MSTMLDWVEIDRQAVAKASAYAPPPPMDPIHAGVVGMFAGLARLSEDRIALPLFICAAAGFALPYLFMRSIKRAHYAAVVRERDNLAKSLSS
ncbi:hypothetical protein [Bosea sp. (in: a-proteobacteria)]|uniref:hypothetical protein n=1 Tax=Bosea sp. (in: a-proteobacteria) TaxID=1871050 RepID=UPI003B3B2292